MQLGRHGYLTGIKSLPKNHKRVQFKSLPSLRFIYSNAGDAMEKPTKQEKRRIALIAAAWRSGCKIRKDDKNVYVFVPGYDIGVGIDKAAEIDSFIATGKPSAAEIIASAKQEAVDTDYYPCWTYILNDPKRYRREKRRKNRKRD